MIRAALTAGLSLLGVLLLGAARPERCPSPGHEKIRHCLLLKVKQPTAARIATLVAMLKKDGFTAFRGSHDVQLRLNASELGRLLAGKYVYRRVAASAGDGWVCNAYVKGVRVPARYGPWIRDVAVDHQICE